MFIKISDLGLFMFKLSSEFNYGFYIDMSIKRHDENSG